MSIVVCNLHVSSQLKHFLFHLCITHWVRVIQVSLQSLKNLGLENNNREKEDKSLGLHFCNIRPPSPQHLTHHLWGYVCRASVLLCLQSTWYFRCSASGLETEAQTSMAEDLHVCTPHKPAVSQLKQSLACSEGLWSQHSWRTTLHIPFSLPSCTIY